MIRLRILNIKEFLKAVNECEGAVLMINPDGEKENIAGNDRIQKELYDRFKRNKDMLPLTLDIPGAKDYIRIVNYYTGDC